MEQSGAQILLESLEKKNRILDRLIGQIDAQEKILKSDDFDMEAFDKALDAQGAYVEQLDRIDRGFEAVYDRVREELIGNRERYRDEIARMQEQIQQITDKIVTINAGNMRNKTLAEKQFQKRRQAIGEGVSKNRVARNYYNSMNNLNYVAPQFYDNKK